MAYFTQSSASRSSIHRIVLVVISVLAFVQALFHYLRAIIGRPDLFYDAAEVWQPAAEAVLNGEALYVGAAADNKPPMFEFLNVLVGATGEYILVFHVLVGLANAVTATLIYRWLARDGHATAGILAALLFISTLPVINGTIINVRSFALVFLFGALLVRGPVRRGVLIAIAALFSQFAVFAIPVLIYESVRNPATNSWQWSGRFLAAGLVTAVTAYAIVGLVWGGESLTNAIQMSLFVGNYVTEKAPLSLWLQPVESAQALGEVSIRIGYVLLPAAVMCVFMLLKRLRSTDTPTLAAFLSISFLATFLVKVHPYYWMFPIAFLAPLAALLIVRVARLQSEEESAVVS